MSHNHGVIRLQVSPAQIYVGRYEALPYPNLTPAQEFVFEVAILAAAPVTISDVLFQTYSGSQLLSERRRNGRSLARLIGEEFPVRVVPGEGLACPVAGGRRLGRAAPNVVERDGPHHGAVDPADQEQGPLTLIHI